jgi:hypothetical protein
MRVVDGLPYHRSEVPNGNLTAATWSVLRTTATRPWPLSSSGRPPPGPPCCDRLVVAYHGAKQLPAQDLLGLHRHAPRRLGPDLSRCGQQQRRGGAIVLEEVIDAFGSAGSSAKAVARSRSGSRSAATCAALA